MDLVMCSVIMVPWILEVVSGFSMWIQSRDVFALMLKIGEKG